MAAAGGRSALSTKIYYGLGSVAFGVKDNGFAYFLLLFYNQVMGVDPWLVSLALLIALCFDAFSDLFIGHLSDNFRSKLGRRHPFMYGSIIPIAISYYMIWNPPGGMSEMGIFWYLLILAILVRTFVTLFEIPSTALLPELTDDYDERTSMLGYRFMFGWWGGLTMAVIAWGVFLADGLTAEGFGNYGLTASIIIVVAVLISAIGTHHHIPGMYTPVAGHSTKIRDNVRELFETLSNRNFLALFVSAIFAALALGLNTSLTNYLFLYFWEFDPGQIFKLNWIYFFSAISALILAPLASKRRDKKHVAMSLWLGAILIGPVLILLRVAGILPENDSGWILPLVMAHGYLEVTLAVSAAIIISSMVADVVEDSERTTGRRSEATLFAARGFAGKVVNGFGVVTAGLILTAAGFPKNAVAGEVPDIVLTKLALLYIPALVSCYLAALYCIRFYKISRDSHGENVAITAATRAEKGTRVMDIPNQ